MKVILTPIGPLDKTAIQELRHKLQMTFGCPVSVAPALEIPEQTYDAERRQYLASGFLDILRSTSVKKNAKVLGVTGADLYTSGLAFVFGQADFTGTAVISLYRLDPRTCNLPPDKNLLLARAVKEAVHELGHTTGLKHCPNPECVMFFSNSLDDTDRKQAAFCSQCRPKLLQ